MMASLQQIKRRFGIVGRAKELDRAVEVAVKVADTDINVLIVGENGSGKESFARIIHALSGHKHGRFVSVNCGAIPQGTLESELFGHEKGAFTGAEAARKGYFEEAEGGTLFLDEVGEMPLSTQPRLLRVLENKEYMRVGSSKKMTADVRVLSATNVDLLARVGEGKFREDLYYRLAQVSIVVPPLRQRGEDILLLFRKFALDFAEQYGVKPIRLTAEAQALLVGYSFPGNVRQLRNVVYQLSILERGEEEVDEGRLKGYLPTPLSKSPVLYSGARENDIMMLYKSVLGLKQEVDRLKAFLFKAPQGSERGGGQPVLFNKEAGWLLAESKDEKRVGTPAVGREDLSLKKHEEGLIRRALREYPLRKEAADRLGISERTLYRKIHEYDLEEE